MGENVRIRYSRDKKRRPKNTLVTIKDANVLYFGIARCNGRAGDVFKKEQGKKIALGRCRLAQEKNGEINSPLCGYVFVDEVKTLLDYFENLDENMVRGNQLVA